MRMRGLGLEEKEGFRLREEGIDEVRKRRKG